MREKTFTFEREKDFAFERKSASKGELYIDILGLTLISVILGLIGWIGRNFIIN